MVLLSAAYPHICYITGYRHCLLPALPFATLLDTSTVCCLHSPLLHYRKPLLSTACPDICDITGHLYCLLSALPLLQYQKPLLFVACPDNCYINRHLYYLLPAQTFFFVYRLHPLPASSIDFYRVAVRKDKMVPLGIFLCIVAGQHTVLHIHLEKVHVLVYAHLLLMLVPVLRFSAASSKAFPV